MAIFPLLNDSPVPVTENMLPQACEIARDPETGQTIWRDGAPVIAYGIDAVLSWAYAALATVRCRHPIYSRDFGCEVERLIGRSYTAEVKRVEALRMVRDALLVSPYITDVRSVAVDFAGTTLAIRCVLDTIYGEALIYG